MAPTKHQGMAKSKLLQAKPVVAKPHKMVSAHMDFQEPLECPLCIEQLDDTDRGFFPCPCGYQVCLFCYQRLQNEYNNTCPGCRQQYGDDLDAVRQHIERKQKQQATDATARPVVSSSSSHTSVSHGQGHAGYGHANGHAPGHAAAHGHAHHHAHIHGPVVHGAHMGLVHAAHRPKQPVPPPPASAKQRQHQEPGQQPRPGEVQGSSLPPRANWVNTAAATTAAAAAAGGSCDNNSCVDSCDGSPLTAADEESWPTLGVAVSVTHHHSQQQQQQHKHDLLRRQSSSSSLASMQSQQQQRQASPARQAPHRNSCDSTLSTASGHAESDGSQQQDEQQQQLEQRNSTGFTAVEVTTVVGGARHSVCVPVSNHSEVSPFPEAATLLDMLQQAVSGNKLSSTEAAVQLVQCLRKLEADTNQKQQRAWLDQALASGKTSTVRNGVTMNSTRSPSASGRPPAPPSSTRAPPPGFGNHPRGAAGIYTPQQQQRASADSTAADRGMPYRPVSSGQSQLLTVQTDNYTSQSSMHSVDSDSSLYSQGSNLSQSAGLWTDSGLPGLDFGVSVGGLGSALGSIPAVPPRLQMLWAGSNGTSAAAATSAGGSGYPTPSIPPGFGTGMGLGSLSSRLSGSSSRLLNGSYNPLTCSDLGSKSSLQSSVPPGFEVVGGLGSVDAAQMQRQQPGIYKPWG